MSIIHELTTRADSSIEDVSAYSIQKLKQRFPNGFKEKRSIYREKQGINSIVTNQQRSVNQK